MSFGKNAYGVQAAANTYYGKPAAELDLAQLAMLAGILKKPEGGNPINGPEWAVKRRNLVLRRMLSQGSIGRAEYEAAVAAPITAKVFQRGIDLPASYPAEWVRVELFKEHGRDIYTGFDVYTTLDSKLQAEAQRALREGLLAYDRRHGYRGPAGRADLASVAPLGDAPTRETPLAATIDQEALTAALADFPASGDLQAGVVLRVRGWEAVVVRRGGATRDARRGGPALGATVPGDGQPWPGAERGRGCRVARRRRLLATGRLRLGVSPAAGCARGVGGARFA